MSLLYDSDNPDNIPDGVWAAGYVDGYAAAAWSASGWARFPNALRIAVFATTDAGDVLDVEPGNAKPYQAGGWVLRAHARGVPLPWVYCDRNDRPAVEQSLSAAGLKPDQVALWIATLDGTQTVPAGPYPVAAVQYAGAATSGGHYDLSLVNDLFSGGSGSLGGPEVLDSNDPVVVNILDGIQNAYNMAVYANVSAGLLQGLPEPTGSATPVRNVLLEVLAAVKAITPAAPQDLSALVAAIQANTAQVAAQTTELNALSTKLSNLTLKAE